MITELAGLLGFVLGITAGAAQELRRARGRQGLAAVCRLGPLNRSQATAVHAPPPTYTVQPTSFSPTVL